MKNKKMLLFIIFGLAVFYAEPIFAANIASCDSVLNGAIIDEKIPNMVSTIITVIKIVVPILLVIMGMLDLSKAITAGKEDEIAKGRKIFIKRLISGALVFLVFTVVQLIVSFVADDNAKDNIATCSNCFINGDCTYKFKDENSKVCPDGYEKSENKKHCVKKTEKNNKSEEQDN